MLTIYLSTHLCKTTQFSEMFYSRLFLFLFVLVYVLCYVVLCLYTAITCALLFNQVCDFLKKIHENCLNTVTAASVIAHLFMWPHIAIHCLVFINCLSLKWNQNAFWSCSLHVLISTSNALPVGDILLFICNYSLNVNFMTVGIKFSWTCWPCECSFT